MKKIILILLLFSACKNKYTYIEKVSEPNLLGSGFSTKDKDAEIIEASNDLEAYTTAYHRFSISKNVYKEMSEQGYASSLPIPQSFQILNDKNKDVSYVIELHLKDSIEKNIDSSVATLHIDRIDRPRKSKDIKPMDSVTMASQSVAYGSIQFGMKEKDFNKLNRKKDAAFMQNIGGNDFMFEFLFDNNEELYFLDIRGFSKDASYLETTIQTETQAVIDVLTKKYGEPEYIGNFPSILNLHSGKISFMRSWEIGNKIIKVGVGEEQASAEFYSSCWIYDETRKLNFENYQEKNADQKKSTDANKF